MRCARPLFLSTVPLVITNHTLPQRRIWENFHQIRLRPEHFPDLLINEVGFERYQTVGRPHHSSRGFSRQLQLFTKVG